MNMFVTELLISVHFGVNNRETQEDNIAFGANSISVIRRILYMNGITIHNTIRCMPVFDIRSISVACDFIQEVSSRGHQTVTDSPELRNKLCMEIRNALLKIRRTRRCFVNRNRRALENSKNLFLTNF